MINRNDKGQFVKGSSNPWNRGLKHTEETKKKMRITHKLNPYWNGKTFSEEHRKKLSESHRGYIMPESQKLKIGEKSRGNQYAKGKSHPHTPETKKKLSISHMGEKGPNWKGGVSPINKRIRAGMEFNSWRTAIYERDDYPCHKCLVKGGQLQPHHIRNFAEAFKLRFDIDNGITLCKNDHVEFHRIYGHNNNNSAQIKEFLGQNQL